MPSKTEAHPRTGPHLLLQPERLLLYRKRLISLISAILGKFPKTSQRDNCWAIASAQAWKTRGAAVCKMTKYTTLLRKWIKTYQHTVVLVSVMYFCEQS